MKSLKTRFLLIFISFALLISLSVGITMYIQYSKYVFFSAYQTLKHVAVLVESSYPVLGDVEYLKEEGKKDSAAYRQILVQLQKINNAFGFTFIYVVENSPEGYLFVIDTEALEEGGEKTFLTYYEEDLDKLAEAVNTKQIVIVSEILKDERGSLISAYIPILKDGKVVSILGLDYDVTSILNMQKGAMTTLIVILTIVTLLAILLGFMVSLSLTKPIENVQRAAVSLAELNLDINIQDNRKDEIGQLSKALMKIRDNFKENINNIGSRLKELTDLNKSLDSSMDNSSSNLGEISHSMNSVKKQSDIQLEFVNQTSSSVEEIIRNIDSLNKVIQNQTVNLNQSSAAIEEMVSNIHSIRSIVNSASQTSGSLSNSAERGREKILQLNEELKKVFSLSQTLQEANKVIAGITGQTNILAMNAAIEAAHAGEAGKGFGVVSKEVRKLAEQSGQESTAISSEIKQMETAINSLVNVSNDVAKAFDLIYKDITKIDETFSTVNHAVEEQDSGGKQILQTLKGMQQMTKEVMMGSDEMQKGSSLIFQEIEKLQSASREVNQSVQNVNSISRGIEETLKNAKNIAAKALEHLEFTKRIFNIES